MSEMDTTNSTSYTSEPDYVFSGTSVVGFPIITVPLAPPQDRALVTDASNPPAFLSGKYLLTRLALVHQVTGGTDPSLAEGNRFEIFVDGAVFRRPFPPPLDEVTPDSDPGVITSVPEPSGFGLAIFGAAVLSLAAWRRKKQLTVGAKQPTK